MSTETNDAELIRRIAAHDRVAVQALFGRYHVRLHRFLVRMLRNDAVAEELVNETFMEVWRVAAKFEGRSAASTWIFTIARNKAISVMRKRSELQMDDAQAEAIEDKADTPETAAQKMNKAELMRSCIERLSSEHREVIDLVYYHEKSVKDVSDIVGIPRNTVKTRMFHARKKLSVLMMEAGVDRGWP